MQYWSWVRFPVGVYGEAFVGRGQLLKWILVTLRGLVSAVARGGYLWFTKKNSMQ
jgi:hypothetical protein